MRIVVTGATGNVGTSVVAELARDDRVHEIVGVSRRAPQWDAPRTRWVSADIARDDLGPVFAGADAVIHLAWLIQPSRDAEQLRRVNVDGSLRVFHAAVSAGVGALVHASSVGVYSAGPKDRAVDESWPRQGTPSLFYARHKVAAEDALDEIERSTPRTRIVRMRPALVFKREAGPEIRRLFAGPFLPASLLAPGRIPVLPLPDRLVFQCVHGDDLGAAYRLAALTESARGAYNIAAEPVLDPATLGRVLGAPRVKVRARPLRALADLSWRARLQPSPPGWLDMGLAVPVMDSGRARRDLGWAPERSAVTALEELLAGMREPRGFATPPLAAHAGGRARLREVLTGVGARR